MYYFIYVLCFVFPVVVHQLCQRWIMCRTFTSKTLSSSSSTEIESLINSTYYSFLALFTNYFVHKMMSHNMFTCCIISCDLRLRIYVWVV
jgi:hypothetical protein